MNQKNKILKALHEEEKPTVMVPDVDDVKAVTDKVDDVNVRVLPMDEMEENTDGGKSKYISDIAGEQPFTIKGKKYIKVNAKHSDGTRGIGIFDIDAHEVYNDEWFKINVMTEPNAPEDYERQSRGAEYGMGDIYEGNPRMTKSELQEMITGKKQPKILKTVKVKNIK